METIDPQRGVQPLEAPHVESYSNFLDSDYQLDMMIKNADITESDIEAALSRKDIDPEEQEYWTKKFQEEFADDTQVADKLRFFALVSNMTREEKIKLYIFTKKFTSIPGIHDMRSHFQSYFSLFPNDKDWIATANKELN